MINLKRCPFCGEKPVAEFELNDVVQIRCPGCGTTKGVRIRDIGEIGRASFEKLDDAYDAAARRWNRRADDEEEKSE